MAQALGIIDVVFRGVRIPVEKGGKCKLGGIKNNPVVYGRNVARSQEFEGSTAEFTTVLLKGQRASDLYTAEEGELQLQLDTGQTVVAPSAFMTERPDLTGGEGGKVPIKFAWGEYEEI